MNAVLTGSNILRRVAAAVQGAILIFLGGMAGTAAPLYPAMRPPFTAIAEDGTARCSIVLPADPSEAEQGSADELREYLGRITGAAFPVTTEEKPVSGFTIAVGGTKMAEQSGILKAAAKLKPGGFILRTLGDTLVLAGRDDLGTQYAVYTLLEKYLGVRWLVPTEIGEVAPKTPTLRIGRIDDTQEPAFTMRWIGRDEWALRNKMNVNVGPTGMTFWGSAHTFRRLVPPEKYFDEHPEYFALVGGERLHVEGSHRNQLCTSNPEVIRLVVERMREVLDAEPGIDVISLFPNDGLGFCECEQCRQLDEAGWLDIATVNRGGKRSPEGAGALSRRLTIFYTAVARELLKSHPERIVKTGIYSRYLAPPKDTTLAGAPNMMGQLCHGWCHNHAITDPRCEVNARFKEGLDRWRRIYPRVCLYEYYWKVAANELPFPILHSMRRDIPYLHSIGVYGLYAQYAYNWGTIGLNYYVAAKLLWDPKTDVDALLQDFYEKFYGPAAKPMQRYFEALERAAVRSDVHLSAEYADLPKIFTAELLQECDTYLSQAERLADSKMIQRRVRMSRLSHVYQRMCLEYLACVGAIKEGLGDVPWAAYGPGLDLSPAQQHADRIWEFLEANRKSNCFRVSNNNYVNRFLSPGYAFRQLAAVEQSSEPVRSKAQWLAARKASASPMPERLDLWICGNDFDSDADKSEHEVFVVVDGERRLLGRIAPPKKALNRATGVCVLGPIPAEAVGAGRVQVLLMNLPGDWTDSSLYAVYFMPHDPRITSEEATRQFTQQLDAVREAAIGFVEYGFYGVKVADGAPVEVTIEW